MNSAEVDIQKLLNLYRHYYEEQKKYIIIVAEGCARFKLGCGFTTWPATDKDNILRKFEFIIDRQQKIHGDIMQYYLHKIAETTDLGIKNIMTAEYTEILDKMLKENSADLEILGQLSPDPEDTSSFDMINSMTSQIVKRIEDKLFSDFKRDFANGE